MDIPLPTQPAPCSKCGGEMSGGLIRDEHPPVFTPFKIKKVFSLRNIKAERANACTRCGYLELFVDPKLLRDILGV